MRCSTQHVQGAGMGFERKSEHLNVEPLSSGLLNRSQHCRGEMEVIESSV